MTAKDVVTAYVKLYPNTLVTPAIAKAFGDGRFGAIGVSEEAIATKMREELRPFARGVFVADPRPLPRPQGVLFAPDGAGD